MTTGPSIKNAKPLNKTIRQAKRNNISDIINTDQPKVKSSGDTSIPKDRTTQETLTGIPVLKVNNNTLIK